MPDIEYFFDLTLQYLCRQFFEEIVDRVSDFFIGLIGKLNCFGRRKDHMHSDTKSIQKYEIESNKNCEKLDILHRSENYLVINKIYDLLINSDDKKKVTVQTILKKQVPKLSNSKLTHEFYFAHRLDYSTSGILCLPLNKRACSSFCSSIESKTCSKFYIALVNGHLKQDVIFVNNAIGDDKRFEESKNKMCSTKESQFCVNPKEALTKIILLGCGFINDRKPVTKVLLMPITGRRHQLRVHCNDLGYPILGDYTYGLEDDKTYPRMFLHAIRLIVPNEIEELKIETDDPFDQVRLKALGIEFEYEAKIRLEKGYENLLNKIDIK